MFQTRSIAEFPLPFSKKIVNSCLLIYQKVEMIENRHEANLAFRYRPCMSAQAISPLSIDTLYKVNRNDNTEVLD